MGVECLPTVAEDMGSNPDNLIILSFYETAAWAAAGHSFPTGRQQKVLTRNRLV